MESDYFLSPPTMRAQSGQLLLHIADDVLEAINNALTPYDISESRLILLLSLLAGGRNKMKSLKPSEIADKLGIKRSSVTKQLNWLEEQGLISRAAHIEDQRMINVVITKKGFQLLDRAMPKYWRTCAEMSNRLTEDETALLSTLLQKIHR